MKKVLWGLLVLAIMVGANLCILNFLPDVYNGLVVFNSESEYVGFKQVLISGEATWGTGGMDVLSSTPPIIARFSVEVPCNTMFAYGEKKSKIGNIFLMDVGILVGVGFIYSVSKIGEAI